MPRVAAGAIAPADGWAGRRFEKARRRPLHPVLVRARLRDDGDTP